MNYNHVIITILGLITLYFYDKSIIDVQLLMLVILLNTLIVIHNKHNFMEGFDASTINNEALQTISSLYNTQANKIDNLNVINKGIIGANGNPQSLPSWLTLSVENPEDSHIRLKTKNDDEKNFYLINRDGHFRIHHHNTGDVFGVDHNGHTWSRHNAGYPLKVYAKDFDTHIVMSTKDDNNKEVQLVNRDGHFKIWRGEDRFGVHPDGISCKNNIYMDNAHIHVDANKKISIAPRTNGQTDWGKRLELEPNGNVHVNGNLCIGNTCINEDHLKLLTGQKQFKIRTSRFEPQHNHIMRHWGGNVGIAPDKDVQDLDKWWNIVL